VVPPPADLWIPPADVLPASGNYLFIDAAPSGLAPRQYLYTSLDSVLEVSNQPEDGATAAMVARASEKWALGFKPMYVLAELEPGYYPDASSGYKPNPTVGQFDWFGPLSRCYPPSGWFVVDSIQREAGEIIGLDVRFEQRCEEADLLHGALHWQNSVVP
jgi:uncharacterized membrane protein YhdT